MVRYYRLTSGRNAGIAVVFGEWPERVLKHRGLTLKRQVCQRVATEEEHTWLAGCNRHQAIFYKELEGLLEDEARIVEPAVLRRIETSLRQAENSSEELLAGQQKSAARPNEAR